MRKIGRIDHHDGVGLNQGVLTGGCRKQSFSAEGLFWDTLAGILAGGRDKSRSRSCKLTKITDFYSCYRIHILYVWEAP